MYQSRYHLTNGIITIGIDAFNGEMLDFIKESSGENVLKNFPLKARGLVEGMLAYPEGDKRFTIPRYEEIRKDASLTPAIRVDQGDGEGKIEVTFPHLIVEGKAVALSAKITIELRKNDCRSYWKLSLKNDTGLEADDIAFPTVNGAWLGETWADDSLVYPHFAGCHMENPTEQLASEPQIIHWKWQEYVYGYNVGQETGKKDETGAYVRRLNYSGEASMLWMDLFDKTENTGLYITCRNESLTMKSLRMQSFGKTDPGVGLAILHRPAFKSGTWTSEECVLALHDGDWHWAADDYRTWFQTLNRPVPAHHRPEWFLKSAGLMAHYDFQYQGGGIVHRFSDIPSLLDKARAFGIDHLLLSGWNKDGFDFGFPHYTPNPNLGTEKDLQDAVAEVKRRGGHVSFYINSRLCNTGFEDEQERIQRSAVMQRNGKLWIEKYGADEFSFASLCIGDQDWRHTLAQTVYYLTHVIGADSMYLDQFAMATSVKCYHPLHKEHEGNPCTWNQGYLKLLDEMMKDYDPNGMALLYEGCNDAFGPYSSGQLISELHCPFLSRMPEVYKYTFPDQILADMMNPRRRSAMRAEHIAQHSTELLHNAFTMGAYYWCYDLEFDNNWRNDPEQGERLRKIVALRKAWLAAYGQCTFRDTVGILEAPENQLIKRYEAENGALLAAANEGGLKGKVRIVWNGKTACGEIRTAEHPESVPCPVTLGDGFAEIMLPDDEEAVIYIHE